MKLILLLLISFSALASPEETIKSLEAENRALREENQRLKNQNNADTARMMEVLQKGKKYQEEQLKALEELEKEE